MTRIMVGLALIVMTTLAHAGTIAAETLTGVVVAIADADTITLLQDKRQHKVRLAGIDCPEKKQAFGTVATQFTADLVFQQRVSVVTTEKDRYGRWIGVVVLGDGRVLNYSLIEEGLCWWYRAYADDPVLATLEAQARAAKRGLWGQEETPTPPWEFRRKPKVKTGG